eukprot:TRINITY_DN3191_c0_g1_i2.p1 TRINITY_DN3191_c0_g1~~TRINITY_DN3191_c0_g1_i2.p1  ORF type:complete len:176 (+),score=39.08 TRINITY_DN3191_c0_g1_i2:84-611(+)
MHERYHRLLPVASKNRPLDIDAFNFFRRASASSKSIIQPLDEWLHKVTTIQDIWSHSHPLIIHGFLTKSQEVDLLSRSQAGTFLLRFSSSRIGDLVVSYVTKDFSRISIVLEICPNGRVRYLTSEGKHLEDTLNGFLSCFKHIETLYPNVKKSVILQKTLITASTASSSGVYLPK